MMDVDGRTRVSLGSFRQGTGLDLFDNAGKPRVFLLTAKEGPGLTFGDADGNRMALSVPDTIDLKDESRSKRPATSLLMIDKENTVIWKAP